MESRGLVFRTPQIEDSKHDRVSLSDKDIEETAAHKDLSVIDIDELEKLLKSKDIISDYNKYCDESAKRISALDMEKTLMFLKCLKDVNSEETLAKLIRESGYKDFNDPEKLKQFIQAKIDAYNEMINKYQDMLEHNYKALKLSASEKEKLSKSLKKDSGDKLTKTLDKITAHLERNKKLWDRSWGADFTKLNGGKVFMNPKENLWQFAHNVRTLYNHSLKFDLIILVHGTNVTPGKNLSKEELAFIDKYKKLAEKYGKKLSKDDLDRLQSEFSEEDKKLINKYSKDLKKLVDQYDIMMNPYRYYSDYGFKTCLYLKDRLLGDLKKNWGFAQPLTTEYGVYKDVNELIRVCIANGHKNIQIMSCNPGGYEIADDIKKMKNVNVSYQKYCVLTESQEVYYGDILTESISLKDIKTKIDTFLKNFKEKSLALLKSIGDKTKLNLVLVNIQNKKASLKKVPNASKAEVVKEYQACNNSIASEISKLQSGIDKLELAKKLVDSSKLLK